MLRTTLLVAALLLPGCTENPFVLQARAVAVCHHVPAQRFEVPARVREEFARLPEAMQHGLALERTFEFDVRAEMPPELAELMETRFALTSIRLTTVNAADDLGFIDEAHLQLEPGASSDLEHRVFDYLRTEPRPRSVVWNGEAFDVARYVDSGTLKYTVSLVGSLPRGDVVVDLDACAEVAVKLNAL